ncbi:AMP-binding protein [Nitrincola iocasae]|jgi:long-chain acyl-CoA synthetase|uniref:Long-chain-fatty-acid--CoA ligase n=1 Tax=Nitrincola iocasae TaxID=2614693 RepID=A0A5J6LGQ8_9GAMM|nr:AMP-binding protein [Nitrincola iocasae]QEW07775.1 AMP-binding protein [Nitrincola iocasae]
MDNQRGSHIPESLNRYGYSNIIDVFERACKDYALKPAFTSFGRTLNYAELHELVNAFAVYLQRETDLKPGDRIAIQLPNLIQYPVVLFGALKAGLVIVNTNPLYSPREMQHQFADSGARALVIHKSMAHNAEKILANTNIEKVFLTQVGDLHGFVKRHLLNAAVKYLKKMEPEFYLPGALHLRQVLLKYIGQQPEPVSIKPSDTAVLQYTGGTTGLSKGAVLSHANLISNMLQGVDVLDEAPVGCVETTIAPLPLYHIYAFTISLVVMGYGGHSVLIPNPRDIDGFVKELKKWQMTAFMGLNTLFIGMCNHPSFRTIDFSQFTLTISGGCALTHKAADLWKEVTGCEIMEGYGLTETSPVVSINRPGAIQLGTIGVPVAATEVAILDPEGEPVLEGTPGELCVKGPQVMVGYWQRERETQACFTDDGYFMTGDVAVREPGGYLRIVDRAKDMILVSGFNVYPNEVEDVFCSHPAILECAAIGVADEHSGEAVKLIAVARDEIPDIKELKDWSKERLTRYKIPKYIEFVADLPKTNVGKVLRRKLKEQQAADKVA